MTDPVLSVVIPAYNEVSRIGPTLKAVLAYLDAQGVLAEIIVVDDGSHDATVNVVAEQTRRDLRVKLIALGRNLGKGGAVRAGMLASRGRRVLFMDADQATPIEELQKLERALDDGADVAIGSRALTGSRIEKRQHPVREVMGRTFNALVRMIALDAIHDTQCGFKLFTRSATDALFSESTVNRFAFDVEILLLARGRFRVEEVPVVWRHVEQSKLSLGFDTVRMAYDLLRLRIRMSWHRRS